MIYENQDKIVTEDFRERIIVDANSPLLAMKANRDRFIESENPKTYDGYPHLGSRNSEDALTWNVFRSLQKTRNLSIITNALHIGHPKAMLIWTLTPEIDDVSGDLQYITGMFLRRFDGKLKGQISEPDVIILGSAGLAVIECKLSEPGSTPSHLWEASRIESIKKRRNKYKEEFPELFNTAIADEEIMPIYQLMRAAFYAEKLAEYYKLDPVVVSLANKGNWSIVNNSGYKKSAAQLWDIFCHQVSEIQNLRCISLFWQGLNQLVPVGTQSELTGYLSKHPCL